MKSPRQPSNALAPFELLQPLAPEARLMFLASRVHSDANVDLQVSATARAVTEWQKVVTLGDLNRVQPLLYRSLRRCVVENIPERTFRALKGQVAITAMRNEGAVAELAGLQRSFDARALRVLHYKGATVAVRFYGELNLRTFHDIDFLIEPRDLSVVCEALEASGYTNAVSFTERERELHEAEQKEFLFQKRGFNIEPHWKFTARRFEFDVDYEGIWRRAESIRVASEQVLVPSTEDVLILMMLVGAAGYWKRLQMLVDIAAVTNGPVPVDWVSVETEMKRLRATRVMHLATYLAHALCGADIPAVILTAARGDPVVGVMAQRVTGMLADPDSCRINVEMVPWRFKWLLWAMREGWRDKLTYLVRTMTTPTSVHTRRMPLPAFLNALYVLLVPLHDYVLVPGARLLRGSRKNS